MCAVGVPLAVGVMTPHRAGSTRVPEPRPDLICDDLGALCWAVDGWESAAWGSVQDASETTRGQAAAAFASETTGYLPDVRVWKRYVKRWDRQDAWDYYGRERAVEDYQGEHASIVAVFRRRGDGTSWQDPMDVATLPPVCPECTHIDETQATVVSLTEREDLGEDREVTPDGR